MEEQLSEDGLPETELRLRMRNLDILDKDADAIEGIHKKAEVIEQLRTATLMRQVYSRRQVHEMMVEFWSDHFNISVEKGSGWALKVVDDRDVIRRHALGSFHDLLSASTHSPAMLIYLDNHANVKEAPNENYARELLELHTLSVDGGYTQRDVRELARCLTGWSVKEHFRRGQFEFNADMHDQNAKKLLGMHIEPAGKREVEQVLESLTRDRSTARHLAVKLLRRFVSDHPELDAPEWIEKLTQVYMVTRGNIQAMLRKLLLDGLARDPMLLGRKVKRPVDFIVSALRITASETDCSLPVQRFLHRMGQPMFAWPTPDGPPDNADHWLSNLAPRWDFSLRLMLGLVNGTEPGVPGLGWVVPDRTASEVLQAASEQLLGSTLAVPISAELLDAFRQTRPQGTQAGMRAVFAGLLASPAFQYR